MTVAKVVNANLQSATKCYMDYCMPVLPAVTTGNNEVSLKLPSCSGWEQLKSIIPFGAAKKPSDASGPDEDQSFTLVFTGNSAMHLAVKGNGRSRNEWVAAFSDLASGLYTDILRPDEPKPE